MARQLFLLSLLLLSSCAKYVQVPPPPDVTNQLKAIADANIAIDQKPLLIKEVLDNAQKEYQMLLDRIAAKGMNIREIILTVITTIAAIATPIVVAYSK